MWVWVKKRQAPSCSFYAAPGGLPSNILLTLALEAPIRQNTWKVADLTFNMLNLGLGGEKNKPRHMSMHLGLGLRCKATGDYKGRCLEEQPPSAMPCIIVCDLLSAARSTTELRPA